MSKISDLLYGDLSTVDDAIETGVDVQELSAAVQNLCRVVESLEKRLGDLEYQKRR